MRNCAKCTFSEPGASFSVYKDSGLASATKQNKTKQYLAVNVILV